jgi:hypothetical protein
VTLSLAWAPGEPGAGWFQPSNEAHLMRSLLLLFLGVPIPIILLLAMCTHHF